MSFQSHAGSIEASGGGGTRLGRGPVFNPTLVRLRQASKRKPPPGALRFSIPRWFD